MLKLVRLFNIKQSGQVIKSVDAEILCDLPEDFDEDLILGLRDEFLEDNSDIFVVWNIDTENDDLVTCEYVILGNFVDIAEWEFRVYSAVAARELNMIFRM